MNATMFLRDTVRGADEFQLLECKNIAWEWYLTYSSEGAQHAVEAFHSTFGVVV